jgi:peptide/nickel transport system permease protein
VIKPFGAVLTEQNVSFKSPWANPAICFNFLVILFLYCLAIFADFICAWQPTAAPVQRVSYQPPSQIRFSLTNGFYFHPYKVSIDDSTFQRSFQPNTSKICRVDFFVQGSEYNLGLFESKLHLVGSRNCPDDLHFIGTDKLGRDYFARLLFGLRPSLLTGILGILISFPLGILYGTIAGYKGGPTGELMMRFVEVILSLPTLYLLVILAAILPPSLSNLERLSLITIILSFIGWAGLARVVRGQVLSVIKREFVQAAYLIGAPSWKIILREVIPQLSSYLIIAAALSFPGYILGETSLSFLGLGINQPDPSLGNILAEGRELSNLFLRPWLAIGPSLVLVLLTWCFNSLGDQLRDIYDPKA